MWQSVVESIPSKELTKGRSNPSCLNRKRHKMNPLTCVEEQPVRLACSEVQWDGVLGTHNGLTACLGHVIRQEFGAAERRLGWCLICKWKSMRMLSNHAMPINQHWMMSTRATARQHHLFWVVVALRDVHSSPLHVFLCKSIKTL